MKNIFLLLLTCLPFFFFAQNQDSVAVAQEVDSLLTLANDFWKFGKYKEALPFAQQAADISKKKWGEEHFWYAASLQRLAQIYQLLQQYAKAEELYLKTIDIRVKVLGKEHPRYVSSLNTLAYMYWVLGEYSLAIPLYLQAKGIREKTLGKEHPEYIISVENLASVYLYNGDYDNAEPLYLEFIASRKKTVGKEHIDYAIPLNTLGVLYLQTGDYAKAEPLILEAMRIKAKTLGKEHPGYATSLDNLAGLYKDKGDYSKAEPLFLEAMKIRANKLGKQHPEYAASLNNLAILYMDKDDFDSAEPLILEGTEIKATVHGKEHPEYARYLNNLAGLYKDKGDYAKAEPLYLEALKIRAKTLDKEHPDYAVSLSNLASLYHKKGDYGKAEQPLLDAIEIQTKVLGKEHPDYAGALNNLIILYQETNRIPQAVGGLLELNNLYHRLIEKSAAYSSERQMLAYLHKFEKNIAYSFSFAQDHPTTELICANFDNALFYGGFLLENVRRLAWSVADADSLTKETYARWQGCRRRLAHEYNKPIDKRRYVAETEAEAEAYEKTLTRNLPLFSNAYHAPRWQDVRDHLQRGEAAIEFVKYRYYTPHPTDSIMYAALVLLPADTVPRLIPMFEERQLKDLFVHSNIGESTFAKEFYGSRSKFLSLFWRPLEPLLREVKTVFYAPTGLLHRINPAALLDESKQPLAAGQQWVRVGSTRDLVAGNLGNLSFAQLTKPSEYTQSAVVYGGIQYDMDSLAFVTANPPEIEDSTLTFHRKDGNFKYIVGEHSTDTPSGGIRGSGKNAWEPLIGSEREVEQIDALLRKAGFRSEVHKGFDASEEHVKKIGKNNPSPRILHLATHGFVYPAPQKNLPKAYSDVAPTYQFQDDPMLRSGLILAGANHYWKYKRPLENRDDGVLVAYEVRDLNLCNTELAVLSACQTGLGDVVGSEGVYGLQRAFRIAGVKFLIVSLWQVPDAQTQELMRLFYENWLEKQESLRDAFHRAQQTLREKEPNPYMWAGFVLVE